MNDRFFGLPTEKQNRILRAAYQIFSENSYKKAPMSEIAAEGDISKALLFYYFVNKKELYLYLWKNAVEMTRRATRQYRVTQTDDFFEMLLRSLYAKTDLMHKYPYLYSFSIKAYYEQDIEIREMIQKDFQKVSSQSEEQIWKIVDMSVFRKDIDIKIMYQEMMWAADGYLRQNILQGTLSSDKMKEDFEGLIKQWKKVYLKN